MLELRVEETSGARVVCRAKRVGGKYILHCAAVQAIVCAFC